MTTTQSKCNTGQSAHTLLKYMNKEDAYCHMQTVLSAHAPKEDVGSHAMDFGAYGDDPLSRTVGAATDMTQTATTHDLSVGTARGTKQVPGM